LLRRPPASTSAPARRSSGARKPVSSPCSFYALLGMFRPVQRRRHSRGSVDRGDSGGAGGALAVGARGRLRASVNRRDS
jgi:hypothetical protein